ncbi:hypothetical protein V1477_018067 [Vespula maculifrons]|uniref:Uncharacterized protein n=1 Tax=Vespula maculifrons TaxID=7453 RepID=A0ABD2B070_VESMC
MAAELSSMIGRNFIIVILFRFYLLFNHLSLIEDLITEHRCMAQYTGNNKFDLLTFQSMLSFFINDDYTHYRLNFRFLSHCIVLLAESLNFRKVSLRTH